MCLLTLSPGVKQTHPVMKVPDWVEPAPVKFGTGRNKAKGVVGEGIEGEAGSAAHVVRNGKCYPFPSSFLQYLIRGFGRMPGI